MPYSKKFEKTNEVDALNSSKLSNKINELKQFETLFPKNQLNDLMTVKLKEIMQLKNNIKLDDLQYTTKREIC